MLCKDEQFKLGTKLVLLAGRKRIDYFDLVVELKMKFGLTASTARDESDESGRGSRPANSLDRLLTASPFPEAGELGTR